MKRWISLFLSLAVSVLGLSLGVSAIGDESPNLDIQDLYVYSSIVSSNTSNFTTEFPQQGQITDRQISLNYNQPYTKFKNFSFTCPANSYFLIDFDVVGDDSQSNLAPNVNPSVVGSRNISSYVDTDFSVYGSNGNPIIYRAEIRTYYSSGSFVHFSIFGLNNAFDANNIVITYTNPPTLTAGLIPATGEYFNQRITNVNCKSSVSLDLLNSFVEEISQTLQVTYYEIVSIGDTLGNFYNEFHQYWDLLNTQMYNIWDQLWKVLRPCYTVTYGSNGLVNVTSANARFPYHVSGSLNSIITMMLHEQEWEQKAIEQGAGDAYDDLNDSASFGSLTDFAGAGSAASWSSGSFSEGLNGGFIWFSSATKDSLDTVPLTRAPNNIINAYDDHIAEYEDIIQEGN